MKTKFEEIQEFVDSLEMNRELSDEQSLLLVGGNGSTRSTVYNEGCKNQGGPGCGGYNSGCGHNATYPCNIHC